MRIIEPDEEFEVEIDSIEIYGDEVIIKCYEGYGVSLDYHDLEWLMQELLLAALCVD